MEYCAIESYGGNKIPFYFSFISTTCFTQISQMEFFGKQFSLISLSRNFVSSLGKHDSPIFPHFLPISYEFPTNPPDFPLIPQFSIQLHKCTLSLSIRPILCILHVSLKMRISHYVRQRIINLGNSGEIQGNSGKIRRKDFHSFPLVFADAKYISLVGKSNSLDFSSGCRENNCDKSEFTGKCEFSFPFISFRLTPQQVSIAQYCS